MRRHAAKYEANALNLVETQGLAQVRGGLHCDSISQS